MGIFDTLKNAIFGSQSQAKPGPATTPQASQAAAPSASAAPTSAAMQGALAPLGGKVPDSLRH